MDQFNDAVITLLDEFDGIAKDNPEIGDTDVREHLATVLFASFITPRLGYTLPEKFGLFSETANAQMKAALAHFITIITFFNDIPNFTTPQERLSALQSKEIVSAQGSLFADYFGYIDPI
uniref:hypothetical protein n=1 Tax=Thaumasiovibrio occultus TaxID=1891184 RepID=UPI000B364000|nr:hypothetical protein [Thaumasiovibrio occultus]